jgi:hypothetical protein
VFLKRGAGCSSSTPADHTGAKNPFAAMNETPGIKEIYDYDKDTDQYLVWEILPSVFPCHALSWNPIGSINDQKWRKVACTTKVEAERLDNVRDSVKTPRMTRDEKFLLATVNKAYASAAEKVSLIEAKFSVTPKVTEVPTFEFEYPRTPGLRIRADDDDDCSSVRTYDSYGNGGSPEYPGENVSVRCMNLYSYDELNNTFLVWNRKWILDGDEILDQLLWVTREELPNKHWGRLAEIEKAETLIANRHRAGFGLPSLTSFDKYSYAAALMEKSIAAMKRSDVRYLVCKECDKKKLTVKAARRRSTRRTVIIR